ncbi:endonuclease/exonuclease/phosphatase family protein [Nocardiopsis sp. EMB25]|uniref:endonuclease/exonuclease/phosphatase family protein n=1 Tax=Nocardiopsis sp. EMB25 TaxID=2835867 RepID=UPI002284E50D|nr:endonuclease/exonuclease/phosphatase family protein [Nocardiopsis sp. EMB25]MCY9783421.1 endonuclease/exonuclease/phosphatase family protein [Nocardiopsis sp. EMB25]
MRIRNLVPAVVAAIILILGAAPASAERQGTLEVVEGSPVIFSYTTTAPHPTNWIGLYHASGGGPADEEYVSPSLVWRYAPGTEGTVTLPADSLEPGHYVAYFLARDGYTWLTEPIDVHLPTDAPVTFPVDAAALRNARVGDAYEADLGGLASRPDAEFAKVDGDAWIDVAADGTLSGTPDGSGGATAQVTVEATAPGGSSARLTATVPVRPRGSALVPELDVLTFNTWHGGSRVNGYHDKQVRFLLESGADVVGLQETEGGAATRLADALGWYHWQSGGSLGVLSRYPIVEEYGTARASAGVRVALDGAESQVNLWTAHLGHTPYGPYDACFDGMDVDTILQREAESGRTGQITDTLAAMADQIDGADDVPVLLVGDFNSPSHLDWTEELREKNCGYADVPWPTSVLPTEAGLVDSFRAANPDPVAVPGTTWSPLYPRHNGSTGRAEPQDRIDFVYHAGEDLSVRDSRTLVVGDPATVPNHADNEWTTDHATVLTTYGVTG